MSAFKTILRGNNLLVLLKRVQELEAKGYECAHPIQRQERHKVYADGYEQSKKAYTKHEDVYFTRYFVQMIKKEKEGVS